MNDARFLDFVLDELTAAAVVPGAICFEITETAAIANLDRVISFMRALKARGCRFSLDDFGTGLSSLTYLKNLPVDYVKIDGQFVRNVLRDGADECVVESIARMARAFKIHAIAERVESRDVMKRLGELGVSFAQGYFIAVPQPVSELPVALLQRPQDPRLAYAAGLHNDGLRMACGRASGHACVDRMSRSRDVLAPRPLSRRRLASADADYASRSLTSYRCVWRR